jgi:hypothetical protein
MLLSRAFVHAITPHEKCSIEPAILGRCGDSINSFFALKKRSLACMGPPKILVSKRRGLFCLVLFPLALSVIITLLSEKD